MDRDVDAFGSNATVIIKASTESTHVRAPWDSNLAGKWSTVLFTNASQATAFLTFSNDGETPEATTAGYPVLPGQSRLHVWPSNGDGVSAVLLAGEGDVYASFGWGTAY